MLVSTLLTASISATYPAPSGLMSPDELLHHNGEPLLNGLFGVGKGKFLEADKSGRCREVLRLIINLIPSNQIMEIIEADVRALPFFGQWLGSTLLADEVGLWTAEDMVCVLSMSFACPRSGGSTL